MILDVVFIAIATILSFGLRYVESRIFKYSHANNRFQRALSYLLLGFSILTGVRMLNIYYLAALFDISVNTTLDQSTIIGYIVYCICVIILFIQEIQSERALYNTSYRSDYSGSGVALGYLYAKTKDLPKEDTIETLDQINDLSKGRMQHMDYAKGGMDIDDLNIDPALDSDILDLMDNIPV